MHMWERKKCCRKRAWVTLLLIVETQDDDDDDRDDGDDDNSDDGDVDDDDDDNNCARGGNLSRHDHCQLLISLQIWAQDRHLTENAQHLSWQNTKIQSRQYNKYEAQNTKIQSIKYNKYKVTKDWTQERPALVLTKQPSPQYQTRGHSSSMSQSTIAKQTLFSHKRKNSQVSRIWPRVPVK